MSGIFDKLPPSSPDHERRVISAMMQDLSLIHI